jgi:two-component system chemotaxis sensor kinase CheA
MESIALDEDIKAFLIESYENLDQIETAVLELGQTGNGDLLMSVYRAFHTIKGNCGFLPFPTLETIAHVTEDLLSGLQEKHLEINTDVVTVLLHTIDVIRQILTEIEANGYETNQDYSALIQTIQRLQQTQSAPEPDIGAELPALALQMHSPEGSSEAFVRVNVGLLDQLMNLVGELALTRNQLSTFVDSQQNSALATAFQQLSLITADLQEGIMKTRMQPISVLWHKFPRVCRDLAVADHKQVQAKMIGAETELDKSILEAIKDPLTHLIRNCIDHGIESPLVRTELGKPAAGRLVLRVSHQADKINIEVSDDGRGIDPDRLKQKAQQLGLITASDAATMTDSVAIDLIFHPGFSTAEQVSSLSGRGVGMDVVKTNLTKINGAIEVQSQIGQGTTFRLKIPLTLAIIPTLIIRSGGGQFAVPQSSLQELVRVETEQAQTAIEMLFDVPVYRLRGQVLPLIDLNQVLQLPAATVKKDAITILVIRWMIIRFGVIVDAIEDIQDVVVKPLGGQFKSNSVFGGATILGDGQIALILDPVGLAHQAGVNTHVYAQVEAAVSPTESDSIDDRETVLVFRGAQGTRMALPMEWVQRLEEIPRTAVERVGDQFVIQYRDQILSLIDLNAVFSGDRPHLTSPDPNQETLSVIVITLGPNRAVGLVVEAVLDIVEAALTDKGMPSRPGVLFYTTIQGQVTEMLDLEYVIGQANAYFLQWMRSAKQESAGE